MHRVITAVLALACAALASREALVGGVDEAARALLAAAQNKLQQEAAAREAPRRAADQAVLEASRKPDEARLDLPLPPRAHDALDAITARPGSPPRGAGSAARAAASGARREATVSPGRAGSRVGLCRRPGRRALVHPRGPPSRPEAQQPHGRGEGGQSSWTPPVQQACRCTGTAIASWPRPGEDTVRPRRAAAERGIAPAPPGPVYSRAAGAHARSRRTTGDRSDTTSPCFARFIR